MTLATTLHFYSFNMDKPEDAAAYETLRAKLKSEPGRGHCMDAFGDYYGLSAGGDNAIYHRMRGAADANGALSIELETAHLFDNQWNTAPIPGVTDKGARVFDWAETAQSADFHRMRAPGADVAPLNQRRGHYLEITPAMIEARESTVGCGYCGKQRPAAGAPVFCPACLDSEYLKESDLKLLRLRPMAERFNVSRPELTDAERAELLPRYRDAQIHGSSERGRARLKAERARMIEKTAAAVRNARRERRGMLWLMDRGIQTANVLYYSHTGRFSFGWRGDRGLSDDVVSGLLEIIGEFPFPYDIKTDPAGMHGGRVLSGE